MMKRNKRMAIIKFKRSILLLLPLFLLTGFYTAFAQEGGDGGVVKTQIAGLSGFTNADTAVALPLNYILDNTNELSKKIKNIITLSVIEETPNYIADSFTANVRVRIYYGHLNFLQDSVDTSLTVKYNNVAGNKYNAKAYISFDNIEHVQVKILQITAPVIGGLSIRKILRLENEMRITRYYQLANSIYPISISAAYNSTTPGVIPDALNVNWQWPDTAGNNYTQLEWTWMENELQSNYLNSSGVFDTSLLFKNNATRIDLPLSVTSYSIPLFYDGKGQLFYRLRAMNLTPSGTEVVGPWSAFQVDTFSGHNNYLNWQVNTAYAEDGKHKTVIQYFDGSLRSRQTVTKDNTTNTTISAETFYDAQGRAAVQILPAPGINNIVAYTQNLNRFNGQAINTDPIKYFDLTAKSAPNNYTTGLNDSSGAAQYYSPLNREINDSINKNIPNADSFPYAVTRYMPDGTGRILSQSGVGQTLKMGSGHETKYYYGTPAQEELDGLFGTEVGNYTHYFQNMVDDANGQMSVSYVDMHGRTIATALAGDAPTSMDTLDIHNNGDYPNQAGTQINRNLLDAGSNIVKNNGSIESINSILAPATTTFTFNYNFPTNALQVPYCIGTHTFNCVYNLEISVTDQSGILAPIVWDYNSISSATVAQTLTLPAGSYVVRKTLSIDQSTFKQYDSTYRQPNNGVCNTLQSIIDSVKAVMEAGSGCGNPLSQVTCQSCLDSLGTYSTFRANYAANLGVTVAALTATQLNDIRNSFITDSLNCNKLSGAISHTLDNIKQSMLADMIPYDGQYAKDPDSASTYKGTMYYQFNIFAADKPLTSTLLYRAPANGGYYTQLGDPDLSVTPTILNTMSGDTYTKNYSYSWANSMLPYHPEYAQFTYAQTYLQATYNWRDNMAQVTTYSQAQTPINYTSGITSIDPLFSVSGESSDQTKMLGYVTNQWQGGISMWQLAYSSVTNTIPTQKYPPFTGLTTTQQDQMWSTFQSLYLMVRDSMVNACIQRNAANANASALVAQGYQLHFITSNSQLVTQLGIPNFFATTPSGSGSLPSEPAIQAEATAISQGGCLSYVTNWQDQLLQCTMLAGKDTATRNSILNQITARMVAVCQQGTDQANPQGSSSIPSGATPTNTNHDTSFEQIVTAVYLANGITKDQFCNPYVINFPKPYGKGPLLFHAVTNTVDSCNCKQYAQILADATAASYDTSSLVSVNTYLKDKYGDTLTSAIYAGLKNCSSLKTKKVRDSVSQYTQYVSKTWYATSVIVDSIEQSSRSTDTTTTKISAAAIPSDIIELGSSYPGVKMTYLKFDSVTTIPSNYVLISATMNLYADTSGYSGTYHNAHAPAIGGDTTTLEAYYPGFHWNKTTSAATFNSGSTFYTTSMNIPLRSSFQDLSIDMSSYISIWEYPALNVEGLVLFVDHPQAAGDSIRYATFYSDKYSDSSKWPRLNINYTSIISDTIPIMGYDTSTITLSSQQPLPRFLQCGFDLNNTRCYTCTALSTLTTQYKTIFSGTSIASSPDLTSASLDTTAIAGNTAYANYLNYETGLQYTWQEYAQAITNTGCNFASPTTATVICPDAAALSDTAGINIATPASPCQHTDLLAKNAAQTIYQLRTQQLLASFDSAYLAKSFGVQEGFTVLYTPKEYHYTLYYYDEAGNLVKTVPPKGVHPDFTNSATVEAARLAGTDVLMPHTYATNYRYNSLDQVIDQKTPDADTSRFWYDQLGRLVISQNGQQVKDGKYSYTIYDALGRITEVGQKPQTTAMTQTISRDTVALKNWLAGISPREQITYTVYDLPSIISGTYITQQYLRNRVSYSYTKNVETDLALFAATYYTYDIHGNVDTLVQDYNGVVAMSNNQNRFKVIAYTYDLISGKVNTVDYQPGHIDAFHHRYNYDASNRLVDVYTSRDSIVWERDATYNYYKHGPLARTTLGQLQVQGIDYSYTLQGWLKGINQVFGGSKAISNGNGCATGTGLDELVVNYRTSNTPQQYTARKRISLVPGFRSGNASDYFYTKLDSTIQPCQLASQGNNNAFATEIAPVANDAYGITLHYYSGDYKSIVSTGTTSLLDGLGTAAAPLYNGNIAAMGVNIPVLGNPLVYNYHYDQLNRITRLDAYNGLNPTSGIFTPVQINDYKERLNYDPNGNIMGYLRNGATSINVAMDSLHYQYNATTNQLNYVTDNVAAANYTEDIDNQATNNYTYDAIGNLKSDVQGGIDSVYWTVYGKISRIKKTVGGIGTVITYSYDVSGNKISKTVTPSTGVADTTCYVRDASGNVLSVYDKSDSLRQSELDMYGSSRLGIVKINLNVQKNVVQTITFATGYGMARIDTFSRGIKIFELTNHLGNVLATVNDKKLATDNNSDGLTDYYTADIVSAQDYSSFGAAMPGRTYNTQLSKYGFNGQLKSDEIGSDQYTAEFWEYDSRIGRRWNRDPLPNTAVSPYAVFNNNPICFSDALGDSSSPANPIQMPNVTVTGYRHGAIGPVPNKSKDNTSFDAGSLTMHYGGGEQTNETAQAVLNTEVVNNMVGLATKPISSINTKSGSTKVFELTEKLDHALTVFDMAQGMYSIVSNKGGNGNPFVGLPIVGNVLGVTGDEIDKGAQEFIDDALKNGYKGALAVFKSNVLAPQSGLTAVYVSQDVYNKTIQQGYLDMSVSYLRPTNETALYPVDGNGVKYSYLLIFKSLKGGTNGQPTKVTNLVAEKIN